MFARRFKPLVATLMLAGTLGAAAHAEGFYAGGGIGNQSYPGTFNGGSTSGSALSGKLYGGYQANPNFAVEAGITEIGSINLGGGKLDSYGSFVDAVGIAPLSPQWSLLGRLGVAHMAVNTGNGDDGGNGIKVGLGAEYALTKTASLRGEWERYELVSFGGRPAADQYTLGVKFGF